VQLNLSTHVENFNQYLPNALHDALKLVTSNVKASKFLSIIERAFKFLKLWRISVIFIYIHPAGNLRRSNSSQLLHPHKQYQTFTIYSQFVWISNNHGSTF